MRRIACLAGLALAASVFTAAPVGASSTPTLGLSVPAHAHAGHPTKVTFHSSGAGSDTLFLQRMTGNTWQTVRQLHAQNGTTTIPALGIGVYDVRLAAYTHTGQLVTAKGRVLHVFGTVKFADLFNLGIHAYSTPAANFHYVFQFYNSRGTYTALVVKNSPCDSLHVQFIPGSDNGEETVVGVSSGTLYLGRHDRSKLHTTVAPQHVGTIHGATNLNSAWSLYVAQAASGGQLLTWYVNGYGDCDGTSIKTWSYAGSQ